LHHFWITRRISSNSSQLALFNSEATSPAALIPRWTVGRRSHVEVYAPRLRPSPIGKRGRKAAGREALPQTFKP
jgi:hypothetical protein